MKSSELRIGNYIQDKNGVDQVYYLRNIGALTIVNDFDEDDYTGIPLTEDWLLKFGLEFHFGLYVIQRFFTYIENTGNGYFLVDGEHNSISKEIKYVHQLQNIYFALTGEELTIKEPAV